MFGFLKRLFGIQPRPTAGDGKPGRDTSSSKDSLFAEPSREVAQTILQRDEILNNATRLCGYRFSVHVSGGQADEQVMLEALLSANVAEFAKRRVAVIALPAQHWLRKDFRSLIGTHTVLLLDLPGQSLPPEAWRDVSVAIRAYGARVGVGVGDQPGDLVRECADVLLVDFAAYSLPKLEQVLTSLRRDFPRIEILVENVPSWPERRLCVSLGAAYCQGPFTTAPDEEQQSGELSPSRLVVIEMLNLLRKGAESSEIAKVAKRDPGVTLKLVAMANSPILGLAGPITGIDHALLVLGREQLYRWLSLAMFRTGMASPRDEVLLELALVRGRFLELVGQGGHDKARCEELFLVGLLSLLDSLLGVPMEKVVARLHLSQEIQQALLSGTGPFDFYLLLATSVEKGRPESVTRLAERLGISLAHIERASVEALAWAESAVRLAP
jgi:EAL and modified HD-GYP domain-containing signal transduction protein